MPASDDPQTAPRGKDGRAPDPFRIGGWTPMREYPEHELVDFVMVGTGAGGGTLACRLTEAGFSVVALDAGPWWRPLEDFASDETHQEKLYWNDERICDGADPLVLGANNSGRSVLPSQRHGAHGRRSAVERRQRRLPKLGYSQSLDLRDGSVFPTVGGVNPSLTIQAIALRTADRIRKLNATGELDRRS